MRPAGGPTARAPALVPAMLALFAAVPAAHAQDPVAILERASERHRSLASFCADFRQEIQNDLLRQTTRSEGELCQARPDRFEMRFTDPPGDRVVADGTHLWVYFPSADPGQAIRTTLDVTGAHFDLHEEFLSDPGRRYAPTLQGTEEVSGRTTQVIALEPLEPSPYLRARVWIGADDHLIHRVEITEDEGFVRTVELDDFRMNPGLAADRFRFEPPPGVQVIVR